MANESKTQRCIAKLGEPSSQGMRVCYQPCEYHERDMISYIYSGWYHVDPSLDATHWPVPESMVR